MRTMISQAGIRKGIQDTHILRLIRDPIDSRCPEDAVSPIRKEAYIRINLIIQVTQGWRHFVHPDIPG